MILLCIVGLLYRQLRAQGVRHLAAGAIVLLVMFIMEVGNRTVRPQLFSYVFFLLTLLVIHAGQQRTNPVRSGSWCDHGDLGQLSWGVSRRTRACWPCGPVPEWRRWSYGGCRLKKLKRGQSHFRLTKIGTVPRTKIGTVPGVYARNRPNRVAGAGRCAGLCLNPYGPKLLRFLLETATVARPDIMEWQPVQLRKDRGHRLFVLTGVSIVAMATAPRRPSPALIAAFACTAVLPMIALRHLPLAAMAAAVFAGEHLAAAWDALAAARSP